MSEPSQSLAHPANTAEEVRADTPSAASVGQLSFRRVLLMTMVCYVVYLFTLSRFTDYPGFVRTFGDNSPYVTIATAIEDWNFSQLHVKLFWGLPYAVTAFSAATRLPNLTALVTISILASLIATACSYKLWGGWVTVTFVILSREWIERSMLGGAEPLFLALLFAGFLAARRQKWGLAALLASLATVVRPMGIFGLAGIGIALAVRRDYRKFAVTAAIGLLIGTLYILPLKLYFGDPLANVNGYDRADWYSSNPVTFPFAAVIHNALAGGATKLNLTRTAVWIAFILLSAFVMAKLGRLREYAKNRPMEVTFWSLYLLFLFTYNSPWARDQFPRFAIPVVPFSAFAMERWIPRNYWFLLVIGSFSALLSAAETAGFLNVIGLLKNAL